MKKLILFGIIFSLFVSCTESKGKSNENIEINKELEIDGIYRVVEDNVWWKNKKDKETKGYWIFSKNEFSIFYYDEILRNEQFPNLYSYVNLHHGATFNYYIKDNYIYSCLCTTDDCLDKKNFSKYEKILKVEVLNNEQIISLEKTKLVKDKGICLPVKNF